MLVVVYLAAIIAANLIIGLVGPAAVIPVGLALIGLDLVARDKLHDRLAARGRRALVAGMGALIAAGGAISYGIALATGDGPLVGRIALASCAAFTLATVIDAVVYHRLAQARPFVRSSVSNVPAAAADSYLFLALAFPGPAPLLLVAGQFAAKAIGGLAWAAVLYGRRA